MQQRPTSWFKAMLGTYIQASLAPELGKELILALYTCRRRLIQ